MRQSTTKATADHQMLLTTAADRSIAKVDATALLGRLVYVDTRFVEGEAQGYVASSFEGALAEAGAKIARVPEDADVICELRVAGLNLYQADWVASIPVFYARSTVPPRDEFDNLPEWIEIGYQLREGWARVQAFAYERVSGRFVFGHREGWGYAHKGFTESIYPKLSLKDSLTEQVR